MPAPDRLFHFTRSAKDVASILATRLEYVHRTRGLIEYLVPNYSADREPQAFGAISLTDSDDDGLRTQFGPFGIAVTFTWALSKRAIPVRYVDPRTSLFDILREDFRLAYADMEAKVAAKYPDDTLRRWAYWNRNVAGILGACEWDRLLHAFEYMEHWDHRAEREWRIVNPNPMAIGGRSEDAAKRAANPWGWFTNPNKLTPADVQYLITPSGAATGLRARLPRDFAAVEIREY